MIDLTTRLGPVTLRSPLIAASGTVGSIVEFAGTVDFSHYGAAVVKSVAPEAWPGRPTPRIGPVDGGGMLNGIGIQNPGIDRWLTEVAPQLAGIPTPVWGSIVSHDVDGFARVASLMDGTDVSAIEVNLSCPNLDGAPFALDVGLSHAVVAAVRDATNKPIGAKLSPDAMPVTPVAAAVVDAGADWVVMGNTVLGAGIDVRTRRPILSGLIGGYSGGPIRPITMRCVLEIRRDLPDVPLVACGGVSTSDHAIEYLLAGADAVALGSVHFARPRIARTVIKGLRRYLRHHDLPSVEQLKGAYEPWTTSMSNGQPEEEDA